MSDTLSTSTRHFTPVSTLLPLASNVLTPKLLSLVIAKVVLSIIASPSPLLGTLLSDALWTMGDLLTTVMFTSAGSANHSSETGVFVSLHTDSIKLVA
jgi:hypothetical protein